MIPQAGNLSGGKIRFPSPKAAVPLISGLRTKTSHQVHTKEGKNL